MNHKISTALFTLLFTLILSACQCPPLYNQTVGNVADVAQRSLEATRKSNRDIIPAPPLVVNQGLYVDSTPISLIRHPNWLRNHIVVRGDQLPFNYYSRLIAAGGASHVLTHFQVGLDPLVPVNMNYSGTVKGALDMLAARTGYVYTVRGHYVYWQAFVTKTFDIAFMPGGTDYLMGKTSNANKSGIPTGPGGGTVTGIIDDSAASQYSNLKGTLSVWDDLKATIVQLMSPEGRVVVSQSTTSVIVRDRPQNVCLIAKYISNLNRNLSRQVLIKVQVLEVQLSSTFNYGINWSIVQSAFGHSNFILNGNNGEPISFTANNLLLGSTQVNTLGLQNTGTGTGFTVLINALKQQGKVGVVSEPRVICLNNQVSAIRILTQNGYLASVQNTTVAGAGVGGSGGTVTSQVTPGTLVTGLTLYVLPKILGNRVYLQVSADLSNNLGFQTQSSGNLATNPNAVQIQVPNVTQKQFNQRSVIASGDTLILSGFRRVSNQAAATQLFDSQELGGRAAAQESTETIVLITPIVLHGLV